MKTRKRRNRRQGNVVGLLYRKVQREKNAKNVAYYYILLKGLFDDFTAFHKAYKGTDAYQSCIRYLANLQSDGNPTSNTDVEMAKVAWAVWMKEHFEKNIFASSLDFPKKNVSLPLCSLADNTI